MVWYHWQALRGWLRTPSNIRMRLLRFPVLALTAFYSLWYALSIGLNAGSGGPDRLLAGVYNLTFWIMGCLVMASCVSADWQRFERLATKHFIRLGVVIAGLSLLALIGWYVMGLRTISIPSAIGAFVDSATIPPLVAASLSIDVLVPDYLTTTTVPRLTALAPYPTATAALLLFALPFVLTGRARTLTALGVKSIAMTGIIVGLYLASSRTVFVGAAISAVIAVATYRRVFALAVILLLVVGLVVATSTGIVEGIAEARSGSTALRAELYRYQTDIVLNNSPVLGMGLKDRVDEFIIPLGSHSTILGALYKTGIGGLMLVVGIIAAANLLWIQTTFRAHDRRTRMFAAKAGFTILATSIWMITEDIDAPPLVAYLFFAMVGYVGAVSAEVRLHRVDFRLPQALPEQQRPSADRPTSGGRP